MSGVLLLPTLNRIELLKRFIQSYRDTHAQIETKILVDSSDLEMNLDAYESLDLPPSMKIRNTGENISMGDKCRFLWDEIKDQYSWVALLNDDHVCLTDQWDQKCEGLIDGANMVSSNDGGWNFGINVVGITAWSMPLLHSCGFPIFPDGISHWFIDNVWHQIGLATGCWQETLTINIEHRHVFCGKMAPDSTYQISQDKTKAEAGQAAFEKFMENDFKGVCERINKLRSQHIFKEKFS